MPKIGDNFVDLTKLTRHQLAKLPNEPFRHSLATLLDIHREDMKQNQILFYRPASQRARKIHFSRARFLCVCGGNRSAKSETALAHAVALATGCFPFLDEELAQEFHNQFRGPINVRIVVESFTTTLYPIILPKLQYFTWVGADSPGGERGHWGWVPKTSLIDGSWERSWSEKVKTLSVLCKDPESGKVLGRSKLQFLSKDQDPSDFASGSFHLIVHDEPPLLAQWRESQARIMDVGGRIILAFTWPDDPAIPVDWIEDEIAEPAKQGKEGYELIELWTEENKNLDQGAIAEMAASWSEETKRVRLRGGSMRFANRIHPLFTDIPQWWCFTCKKLSFPDKGRCLTCGDDYVAEFCHVQDFDIEPGWPTIFAIDPHPRKPHMWMWAQIDPADDIRVVAEGELADSPAEVARAVFDAEETLGLRICARLIDPNMGRSPSNAQDREQTWQDDFDASNLICDLADDSAIGRSRVNEYLKPDEYTHRPRLIMRRNCINAAYQMKRYVWDDYKTALEKDQKQKPRPKYDDYPALLRYLMNFNPTFSWLVAGPPVIRRGGTRKGAY